ncbi:hypothetical protein [Nocardia puris]|uniref:Uncharacterized protein n=1 Tax=Nocardia puris TaxID=208602 RepID=A0A366DAH4_9NOCA|nr:hypothetical protein [Nocardia puris]RBO87047.1 hypothetical protein DFR74_112226 [Nocardia puris]
MTTWTITHPDGGHYVTADATEAREIIERITSTGVAPTVEIADAPPAEEFDVEITEKRQRAGRMADAPFSVRVTDPWGGVSTWGGLWKRADAEQSAAEHITLKRSGEYATLSARQAAAKARQAAKPAAVQPAPAKRPATRDRQAMRVADLMGLPAPAATGRCHYCGQPLDRRGRCTECV